jgi:ssDNA-binding replication factor A large subunit
MPKYRALVDVLPNIKAGDIVTINDDLIPEYKNKFERVIDESGSDEDTDKTEIINPSREDLKAKAAEYGLDHAPNISTPKLLELVQAEEERRAKAAADEGDGNGEGQSGE